MCGTKPRSASGPTSLAKQTRQARQYTWEESTLLPPKRIQNSKKTTQTGTNFVPPAQVLLNTSARHTRAEMPSAETRKQPVTQTRGQRSHRKPRTCPVGCQSGRCKGTRGFRSSDIRKCLMFMAPLERRPPRCRCVKCRRAEYSAPGALICEPTNGLIPAADANGVLQLSLGCADLRQPHDPHSFLVRRVDLNRRPHKPTFARLFPSEACRCFTSCPSHGSLFEFHPGRSATDYSG